MGEQGETVRWLKEAAAVTDPPTAGAPTGACPAAWNNVQVELRPPWRSLAGLLPRHVQPRGNPFAYLGSPNEDSAVRASPASSPLALRAPQTQQHPTTRTCCGLKQEIRARSDWQPLMLGAYRGGQPYLPRGQRDAGVALPVATMPLRPGWQWQRRRTWYRCWPYSLAAAWRGRDVVAPHHVSWRT